MRLRALATLLVFTVAAYAEPKPGEVVDVEIAKGVRMKYCWIPAGETQLGSPKEEQEYVLKTFFETPQPSDFLNDESQSARGKFTTRGFWMGKYVVMQSEWEVVMGSNPSYFSKGGEGEQDVVGMRTSRFPVENVSWDDCQEFLKRLNATAKLPLAVGKGRFVLPTDDQWEYACRVGKGNKQPFYFGDTLNGRQANIDGTIPYGKTKPGPNLKRTVEVGSYEKVAPHPWGLCDMCGNVWQLCENKFGDSGNWRCQRGGSWVYSPRFARSAHRGAAPDDFRYRDNGCRVVVLP